jgi:photosystem II stability/assembly factor-like uncharacterized protein
MLLVGTKNGLFCYAARDGRWELERTALSDAQIGSVSTLRDSGQGRIAVGTFGDGAFESVNGGETWAHILGDAHVWSTGYSLDGSLFIGVEPAGIYRRRAGEELLQPLASVSELPTYSTWNFPTSPYMPNIRWLTFSHERADTVYAGVEVGGVLRTDDAGQAWKELREGLHLDIHSVAVASGDEDVLYAATGRGFYRSQDRGDTWQSTSDGFNGIYLVPIAVHAQRSDVVFSASTDGRPRYWRDRDEGAAATVYRTEDGGITWKAVLGEPPDTLPASVDALVMDRDVPDTVYAGTIDGKVYSGESLGDSWSVIADGLPDVRAMAVL